jgi:hypothetical protein
MDYITNAFSLNMLASLTASIASREIPLSEARAAADGRKSIVGYPDTARIFSEELGLDVPCNRESVALESQDTLLVGQYRGPRLPEGATALPPGSTIAWALVTIG